MRASSTWLGYTLALILSLLIGGHFISAHAQPTFKDARLKAELVVAEGLSSPTSMAFVDNNIILVLEKNSGEVHLVSNGILQQEPAGLSCILLKSGKAADSIFG